MKNLQTLMIGFITLSLSTIAVGNYDGKTNEKLLKDKYSIECTNHQDKKDISETSYISPPWV